eukprot:scaffold242976_cov44-Attheya_sp.AAC.1
MNHPRRCADLRSITTKAMQKQHQSSNIVSNRTATMLSKISVAGMELLPATQQSTNTIQGLRTGRRWRNEGTSGGIRGTSTTSLEGVERGATHAITSHFHHINQPIGHTAIPITSLAIPLSPRCITPPMI